MVGSSKSRQCVAVIAAPAVEEVAVPGLVDLPRVGRRRPVGDAAGADDADALGLASTASPSASPNAQAR